MINATDKLEIESIIMLIDTAKSNGRNSIPNSIIKLINQIVSVPIMNICNQSFMISIFPETLKISKVIPIHKKDSKMKVSKYILI